MQRHQRLDAMAGTFAAETQSEMNCNLLSLRRHELLRLQRPSRIHRLSDNFASRIPIAKSDFIQIVLLWLCRAQNLIYIGQADDVERLFLYTTFKYLHQYHVALVK